jgi:hypothetical protein
MGRARIDNILSSSDIIRCIVKSRDVVAVDSVVFQEYRIALMMITIGCVVHWR